MTTGVYIETTYLFRLRGGENCAHFEQNCPVKTKRLSLRHKMALFKCAETTGNSRLSAVLGHTTLRKERERERERESEKS